jgi:hypothetical protein
MYHVSMAPRSQLLRHGIDFRRAGNSYDENEGFYGDSPPANYLWPTLAAAQRWAERYCENARIYAVDVSGLPLHRDLFWDDLPKDDIDYQNFIGPRGGRPSAHYSEQPIPPERLRLLKPVARREPITA